MGTHVTVHHMHSYSHMKIRYDPSAAGRDEARGIRAWVLNPRASHPMSVSYTNRCDGASGFSAHAKCLSPRCLEKWLGPRRWCY